MSESENESESSGSTANQSQRSRSNSEPSNSDLNSSKNSLRKSELRLCGAIDLEMRKANKRQTKAAKLSQKTITPV